MKTPAWNSLGRLLLASVLVMVAITGTTASANPTPQQLYSEGRIAYEAGDYETAVLKLGKVLEAVPSDARSRALFLRAQQQLANDPGRNYRKQVAAITLQQIEVEDVTMQEFVDYVRAVTTAAHKEQGAEEDGFVPNILLRGEEANQTRFSMRLRNVPLDEALRMAGQLAGVHFRYEQHAVLGTPAGAP